MTRAFVVAFVLAGCSHRAREDAAAPLTAVSSDDVVATVDGRPIFASDVARQARARGVDRRQALEDLIAAEALAGEAARRGLDRDLDVRLDTRGAMVRRLLQTTFERDVTVDDVPTELVRKAYLRNQPYLNHDVYIHVWHILVPVGKNPPPEKKAQARALAEELAQQAKKVHSLDEFKQLAQTQWQGGPLPNEEILTERDGWTEKSFSHAAFDQLHKPGDTSGVVETHYGYHVEYLIDFKPAEHVPFAEAAPALRRGLFPALQQKKLAELVGEAMARHHVEEHPERLPKPGDEP
jgi:parvulin-like peptidyl-prolyl isomerase